MTLFKLTVPKILLKIEEKFFLLYFSHSGITDLSLNVVCLHDKKWSFKIYDKILFDQIYADRQEALKRNPIQTSTLPHLKVNKTKNSVIEKKIPGRCKRCLLR